MGHDTSQKSGFFKKFLLLSLDQALGLVLDLHGDSSQLLGVLLAMVGAEHELATGCQYGTDICLGAATIAAVEGIEGCGFE